jgi:predicted kinase
VAFAKPAGRDAARERAAVSGVIYFFLVEPGRIYMAAIYAKSRKETLSEADQNVLAKVAAEIKKAAKEGR